MKKLMTWMIGLIVAIIVAACTEEAGSDNYLSVVPNDAILAVKVNWGSLLDKSQLLNDPQVKGLLRSNAASLDREGRDLLEALLEDPESSGIDLRKPMVVALVNVEHRQGVVVMAIKDKSKFEALINAMNAETSLVVGERDGISTLGSDGTVVAGYDASRLVIPFAEANADPLDYMNLRDSRKAIDDSRFDTFFACDKDVALYVDYEQVMRLASYVSSVQDMDMSGLLRDQTLDVGLGFETGAIELTARIRPSEECRRLVESSRVAVNGKNLKCVPSDALMTFNGGIRNLALVLRLMPEEAQREVCEILGQLDLTLEDLNALYGDLTLAILPEPSFMMMAQCNDRKLYDAFSPLLSSFAHRVSDDIYEMSGYYGGYVDDCIFVMPASVYGSVVNGNSLSALSQSFVSSRLNQYIEGDGLAIDINATLSTLEQIGLTRGLKENEALPLMRMIDVFTIKSSEDGLESIMRIELNDKSQNSLRLIKDQLIGLAARNLLN